MTICALVACALVSGSLTACQPGVPHRVAYVSDPELIETRTECVEIFYTLKDFLELFGVGMKRFEYFAAPREPNPLVPSVNELLKRN